MQTQTIFKIKGLVKDDVSTFKYIGKIGKKDHIIELIKPSVYQITADSCYRTGNYRAITIVETEWFRRRKIKL